MSPLSVTIAVPVYREEQHLASTLEAIAAQTYERVVEILVVDGGSTDRTVEIAESFPGVRVLEQPGRQAAALNAALREAKGDVFVRVDGHCTLEPDYIERCVDALVRTNAAMVGGAMRPVGAGWQQRGIAAAMTSRLGHGPARFHTGGPAGWVDAVYLGAYRRDLALEVGGYDEGDCNEDAEFAIRMRPHGGIWFDPSIRSTYMPRASLTALARQFYLYGRARSLTVREHPTSLRPRQLAAPALMVGLCTPWRGKIAAAYATVLLARVAAEAVRDPGAAPGFALAMPTMHATWAVGFVRGLLSSRSSTRVMHVRVGS